MIIKKVVYLLGIAATLGCAQSNKSGDKLSDTTAISQVEQGQPTNTVQPKLIENIPAFRILTTDSVFITQANLKKNQPVIIIYFAPDCDHCVKFMNEVKPHLNEFKKLQVVMITWTKYETLEPFRKKMGLDAYKNITIGTEGDDLLIQQYFQIKDTPYIAIYNQNGKLVKTFAKPPKANTLVALVKGM
ncbi:hypothetical protein DJ568_13125 [Mucilaginibacter hurinus]|uniref:Thioredoxin domain-containing protein n=2 Tax=Mucilaginibacter hurinus TaxID=2201324 RepID=A0A367GMH3_9SPHI|nr:hypothetical protein DJ568_13125 [Mucilaginibacter hurinus]